MSESKILLQVRKGEGWVTVVHLTVIDGILQESPNDLVRIVYPKEIEKLEEIKLAAHLEEFGGIMKKTTITISTKTKRRAIEIVNVLSPLVQAGETIEYEIEDIVEDKQESNDKLHRKEVNKHV